MLSAHVHIRHGGKGLLNLWRWPSNFGSAHFRAMNA